MKECYLCAHPNDQLAWALAPWDGRMSQHSLHTITEALDEVFFGKKKVSVTEAAKQALKDYEKTFKDLGEYDRK